MQWKKAFCRTSVPHVLIAGNEAKDWPVTCDTRLPTLFKPSAGKLSFKTMFVCFNLYLISCLNEQHTLMFCVWMTVKMNSTNCASSSKSYGEPLQKLLPVSRFQLLHIFGPVTHTMVNAIFVSILCFSPSVTSQSKLTSSLINQLRAQEIYTSKNSFKQTFPTVTKLLQHCQCYNKVAIR